jgi:serine/threonine protein kinase
LTVKVISYAESVSIETRILPVLPEHINVIRYLGCHEKQPALILTSILLEYCAVGDLSDFRHRSFGISNGTFPEAFMWKLVIQLASAVAFLYKGVNAQKHLNADHWKPVVHHDIKPGNVCIEALGAKPDSSDIELRLGDFGVAELL